MDLRRLQRSLHLSLLKSVHWTLAHPIPRSIPLDDRSWTKAVQSINGLNSILTLLPVLTGKVQNIKLVASRAYPASIVPAGIGAGRVLSKLQLGILLCSAEFYRNIVAEFSYPHDEYVNKFAPILHHVPTATPERHATGLIINHNLAESYMVEAWFRTQGQPAIVVLRQNNYTRIAVGFSVYVIFYAAETYLAMRNAADKTAYVFLTIQGISVCAWLSGVMILQVKRGQGKEKVELNSLNSPSYRCFTLSMLGEYVSSQVFSIHLNNLNEYRIFAGGYEQSSLAVAGILILASAGLDVVSTLLVVGLTAWAYPWMGLELLIIAAKVVFCVEPLREIEIRDVILQNGPADTTAAVADPVGVKQIPLKVNLESSLRYLKVCTDYNVFEESTTGLEWQSTSAGLWIGQEYVVDGNNNNNNNNNSQDSKKYLALSGKELTLTRDPVTPQENQALQREFLAALKVVVEGNKIPSREFLEAIDRTLSGVRMTMSPEWYRFGSKDILDEMAKAKRSLRWRRWL